MGVIRAFFRYTFRFTSQVGDSSDVVEEVSDYEPGKSNKSVSQETRSFVVIAINWTMLLILVAGFADVIVSSWIRPEARVPDLVQDVVSGAAGYFLSALASFVRHD
jgi:hypothetical protein